MERVETLCDLLAEKIRNRSSVNDLLNTVKMLESELIHLKNTTAPGENEGRAEVKISKKFEQGNSAETNTEAEEKITEVLLVDEAEIEAELEEIKKNAADRNKISIQNKPTVYFDPVDDIPTLAGRQAVPAAKSKEIHELIPLNTSASLNETLHRPKSEVKDTLQQTPVKDLRKAIGVNDRYQYLNELFRGDEAMYERSIKTINSFAIFPEAEYWIRRELKLKLGWDDKNETVQQFDQLVRRRFS